MARKIFVSVPTKNPPPPAPLERGVHAASTLESKNVHTIKEVACSDYYEVICWELRYAIRRYNENWLSVLCREKHEQSRYLVEVEQHRLTVIVLTCTLMESAINIYLSTKCDDEKSFKKLDRRPFEEKWAEVPKQFVSEYKLTAALAQDLRDVNARRNSIVHNKPMISINGRKWHEGNQPSLALDEHAFMEHCTSLPVCLIEQILKFDPDAFWMRFIRKHCACVQSEFQKGQHFIQRCSNVPEELIKEIMTRGHERHTATYYALLVGDRPEWDRDGNIVVARRSRDGIEVIARLKPLNFFAHQKRKLFIDGGAE